MIKIVHIIRNVPGARLGFIAEGISPKRDKFFGIQNTIAEKAGLVESLGGGVSADSLKNKASDLVKNLFGK